MSKSVTIFLHIGKAITVACCLLVIATSLQAQPHVDSAVCEQAEMEPLRVKEYMLDGRGSLSVFTISGDINVTSGTDTRKVRIELYAERGFSLWSYGNPLDNYQFTSVKRGNDISTSVEPKNKQKSSFWGSHTAFSYKIIVPRDFSTSLKTLNGSVTLQNVNGDHLIKTNAGDIRVRDTNGVIKAYATAGDIEIEHGKGTFFARADGGNINTHDTAGEMRFKIHGGTIRSSRILGSMVAVVNGGDIEARFDQVDEGVSLQANAGNIDLIIPEEAGYMLHARGSGVRFDDAEMFKGTYSNNMIDGEINGGGIPLSLNANAGRIVIQLQQ